MFASSTVAFDHSILAIDKIEKCYSSLVSIVTVVQWSWNILLRFSLFPYQIPTPIGGDDFKLGNRNHCSKRDVGDDDEEVECAICLCKIDEDDEIPELRCDHLFHKVCLDRWVGHRRTTCPVCRRSLTPRQLVSGMEVILFKYCSFDDTSHRETWWLR
ncbi:RING-H2 finger protein ATL78-like [Gossypium australe]|uniref:RING-H2 finger protein ATL78-like n=1 Tax=Gossypium australe TaxID=47621 RepID=A0A5B6VGA7_9ROSI|nr:RING-H2 finger protein ATL78-like [Gossypium australe]